MAAPVCDSSKDTTYSNGSRNDLQRNVDRYRRRTEKTVDSDSVMSGIQRTLDKYRGFVNYEDYCDFGDELRSICLKESYRVYKESTNGMGFASLIMLPVTQARDRKMKLKEIFDYMADADVDICGVAPSVWRNDGKFKLKRQSKATVYVISSFEDRIYDTQDGVDIFLSEKAFEGLMAIENVSSAALSVKVNIHLNGKNQDVEFLQAYEPPEKLQTMWTQLFSSLVECFEYRFSQIKERTRSTKFAGSNQGNQNDVNIILDEGFGADGVESREFCNIKSDLSGITTLFNYTECLQNPTLNQCTVRQAEIYNFLVRLKRVIKSVKVESPTQLLFSSPSVPGSNLDLLLADLAQKQQGLLHALQNDWLTKRQQVVLNATRRGLVPANQSELCIMAGVFSYDHQVMGKYYQDCLSPLPECSNGNSECRGVSSLYCTRTPDKAIEIVPDYLRKQFDIAAYVKEIPMQAILSHATVQKVDEPNRTYSTSFSECIIHF